MNQDLIDRRQKEEEERLMKKKETARQRSEMREKKTIKSSFRTETLSEPDFNSYQNPETIIDASA